MSLMTGPLVAVDLVCVGSVVVVGVVIGHVRRIYGGSFGWGKIKNRNRARALSFTPLRAPEEKALSIAGGSGVQSSLAFMDCI